MKIKVMQKKPIIILNVKILKIIMIFMFKQMYYFQVMYLLVIEKNPFGIDPLYCISTPGFSNRTMLKMSNLEIKLITDPNVHLFIKKRIRGRRCEPIYYHAKANNKYVNPKFDKKEDKESYIVSLDANSLYSTAMCCKLPYEEPQFDNETTKYTIDSILSFDPNGDCCYIFNVDMHYPSKLHDRDFEFPILCEQTIPPNDKTKKLMSTFYDKQNYTIYFINL